MYTYLQVLYDERIFFEAEPIRRYGSWGLEGGAYVTKSRGQCVGWAWTYDDINKLGLMLRKIRPTYKRKTSKYKLFYKYLYASYSAKASGPLYLTTGLADAKPLLVNFYSY